MKLKFFLGLAATERLAVIALVLLLPQFSPVALAYPTPERTYEVGLHTITLDYIDPSGGTQFVEAAIWYPTDDKASIYTYSDGARSYLAIDGELSQTGTAYPLVIFNHGFNASEMQSLFLKETLASEGYIVASVRFSDNIWGGITEFLSFADHQIGDGIDGYLRDVYENYFDTYRLPAAEALLDYMISESDRAGSLFQGGIDISAIGMGGHSFGGLTTLGLIGGHSDPAQEDPRIKAALLLSSPSFPFEKNIGNIDVPIMAMRGDYDLLLNRPEDAFWYLGGEVQPPYYYLVLRNADHFVFSESDADTGWVPAAIAEDERLKAIDLYALAFFDLYLKGDASAATTLSQTSTALLSYDWLTAP
ncbi:dienelactone hydrolase [Dehalogenimonas sp. THU2]|uniref:alpha/beta hydrolase family protein n=1 Tax=Dehalogenimonas sp. THU2 TaxID=3151121 RepID=UPI003218DDF6